MHEPYYHKETPLENPKQSLSQKHRRGSSVKRYQEKISLAKMSLAIFLHSSKPGCCFHPEGDFILLNFLAQGSLCLKNNCAAVGKCVLSQLPFFHCRVINRYFSWRAVNSHYTGLSQSCLLGFFHRSRISRRHFMLRLTSLLHTPAHFEL